MHNETEGRGADTKESTTVAAEETRPQQAGEAATTRFGMEDGDNTDVPATGGPTSDEEGPEASS